METGTATESSRGVEKQSALNDKEETAEYEYTTEIMDLSRRGIVDPSPLSGCAGLKKLILADNHITDISALSALHLLEFLDISNNKVECISPCVHMTKLHTILLINNQICDVREFTINISKMLAGWVVADFRGNPLTSKFYPDADIGCAQPLDNYYEGLDDYVKQSAFVLDDKDFVDRLYYRSFLIRHFLKSIDVLDSICITRAEIKVAISVTESIDVEAPEPHSPSTVNADDEKNVQDRASSVKVATEKEKQMRDYEKDVGLYDWTEIESNYDRVYEDYSRQWKEDSENKIRLAHMRDSESFHVPLPTENEELTKTSEENVDSITEPEVPLLEDYETNSPIERATQKTTDMDNHAFSSKYVISLGAAISTRSNSMRSIYADIIKIEEDRLIERRNRLIDRLDHYKKTVDDVMDDQASLVLDRNLRDAARDKISRIRSLANVCNVQDDPPDVHQAAHEIQKRLKETQAKMRIEQKQTTRKSPKYFHDSDVPDEHQPKGDEARHPVPKSTQPSDETPLSTPPESTPRMHSRVLESTFVSEDHRQSPKIASTQTEPRPKLGESFDKTPSSLRTSQSISAHDENDSIPFVAGSNTRYRSQYPDRHEIHQQTLATNHSSERRKAPNSELFDYYRQQLIKREKNMSREKDKKIADETIHRLWRSQSSGKYRPSSPHDVISISPPRNQSRSKSRLHASPSPYGTKHVLPFHSECWGGPKDKHSGRSSYHHYHKSPITEPERPLPYKRTEFGSFSGHSRSSHSDSSMTPVSDPFTDNPNLRTSNRPKGKDEAQTKIIYLRSRGAQTDALSNLGILYDADVSGGSEISKLSYNGKQTSLDDDPINFRFKGKHLCHRRIQTEISVNPFDGPQKNFRTHALDLSAGSPPNSLQSSSSHQTPKKAAAKLGYTPNSDVSSSTTVVDPSLLSGGSEYRPAKIVDMYKSPSYSASPPASEERNGSTFDNKSTTGSVSTADSFQAGMASNRHYPNEANRRKSHEVPSSQSGSLHSSSYSMSTEERIHTSLKHSKPKKNDSRSHKYDFEDAQEMFGSQDESRNQLPPKHQSAIIHKLMKFGQIPPIAIPIGHDPKKPIIRDLIPEHPEFQACADFVLTENFVQTQSKKNYECIRVCKIYHPELQATMDELDHGVSELGQNLDMLLFGGDYNIILDVMNHGFSGLIERNGGVLVGRHLSLIDQYASVDAAKKQQKKPMTWRAMLVLVKPGNIYDFEGSTQDFAKKRLEYCEEARRQQFHCLRMSLGEISVILHPGRCVPCYLIEYSFQPSF